MPRVITLLGSRGARYTAQRCWVILAILPLLGCLLGSLKQGTPVAFGSESEMGADGELSLEPLSYQPRLYDKHNPNSQTSSNSRRSEFLR